MIQMHKLASTYVRPRSLNASHLRSNTNTFEFLATSSSYPPMAYLNLVHGKKKH
jgi:hypothetical protein